MTKRFLTSCCCLLFALLLCQPSTSWAADKEAHSEQKQSKEDADKEKKADDKEDGIQPKRSITEGVITIDGKEIKYSAVAGKMIQQDDHGDQKAEIFFIAYTKGGLDEESNPAADARRPITYCFNGGPGSSSVWLHLGMLGPQRVRLPDDASYPQPPFSTIDNPYSLLDTTDLVFIDPVGTGLTDAVHFVVQP